jgi:nitric oxide reductase NorQ protein
MTARVLKTQEYFIEHEPYYESIGDEVEVFEAAYKQKLPV